MHIDHSPWHEGERALQARLGLSSRMNSIGQRAIRNFMPDQHREFFAQLPFLVIGAKDDHGRPWASMLTGKPGFVASPSPTRLNIQALPQQNDPLAAVIAPGRGLATLGIELPTRRRNRANGRIGKVSDLGFSLEVEESFGNCPKYIVRRDYLAGGQATSPAVERLSKLDPAAKKLIREASTFFVATDGPPGALPDVSHRGGLPGFVEIEGDSLSVPDYVGNNFFNTLGNMLLYPYAGLLFVDFMTGDLLQLTGTIELIGGRPDDIFIPGERGFWRLHVSEGLRHHAALRTRFGNGEMSPFALAINGTRGDQDQAGQVRRV